MGRNNRIHYLQFKKKWSPNRFIQFWQPSRNILKISIFENKIYWNWNFPFLKKHVDLSICTSRFDFLLKMLLRCLFWKTDWNLIFLTKLVRFLTFFARKYHSWGKTSHHLSEKTLMFFPSIEHSEWEKLQSFLI